MIGIIPSESPTHFSHSFCLITLFSIHAKLRDADPGYDIISSFFLCYLYQGEDGDSEHPLEGFLKGPPLVHVSHQVFNNINQLIMLLCQAFQHIFTSPSSATNHNTSEATSRRHNVANILHMNNCITLRSIAYAATQVHSHHLMVFSSSLCSPPPPPSSSFHSALHENGSVNTMGSTTHHSTTLSLTFSRILRMIQLTRMLVIFLNGGISTSY